MASAVVDHVESTIAAVNESAFPAGAEEVIQVDWTTSSSIEGIIEGSGTYITYIM